MSFATYMAMGVAVTADARIGIGTVTPTSSLDIAIGSLRIRQPATPAPNSACKAGDIGWDANYVYVCVADNTWRRAALSPY